MVKEEQTKALPANIPWSILVGTMLLTVLLVVGAVFGMLYVSGVLPARSTEIAVELEQEYIGGEGAPRQAIYVPMEPPFVVNFEGRGPARFLQVSVEVMTREPDLEEQIKIHTPVIRNNLVLLFSRQTYQDVATHEGKEKLRQAALAEVRKILEVETGRSDVEALLFTSFVMQ